MSDLAPGDFGSADEWTIFQGFFRNPTDVNGTAQKLEAAAAKAYKKG
jgi:alpha-glucoside transport system substrate-binding protein